MSQISDNILEEFKSRMRIAHQSENDNLKRILSASLDDIKEKCGEFSIEKNRRGKELVFERARYVYNDSVEYFDDNFLSQLTSLAFELWEVDSDETTV